MRIYVDISKDMQVPTNHVVEELRQSLSLSQETQQRFSFPSDVFRVGFSCDCDLNKR